MNHSRPLLAVIVAALALTLASWPRAFAASAEEPSDVEKKILGRLDAQEKILNQILQRLEALPKPRPAVDPNRVYELPLGRSIAKGGKNAKVTIVEFSDFQCPFCARSMGFTQEILQAFPDDVRLVYKHLPLVQIHPNAMPAAKASVAAGNQGKFWEMHDALFAEYNQLSAEKIRGMAETLKLDMEKFDADLAAAETQKAIDEDVRLAEQADVRGTPSFFLNGRRLETREIPAVKALIQAELAKK